MHGKHLPVLSEARKPGISSNYPLLGKMNNVQTNVHRLDAPQVVSADSPSYNMRQNKRGYAIIFKHEYFDSATLERRECASHDAMKCKEAFKALRFDVLEYSDLQKDEFYEQLDNIRNMELSNCDCLVVIFMSHGCEERDKEYIWLRDKKVLTSTLWSSFTADKCKQLAGKPKLFFIQACRGETTERGIKLIKGLSVQTDGLVSDSIDSAKKEEDYVIPLHSDMLMMWASYPGMYAFRSQRDGISGSVFLHFLCQILLRDHEKEDISSMLLTVTRYVAIHYESSHSKHHLNNVKQTPYTVSTLMRKVFFSKQA
ncbi:unnamed protein product, partial [Meganyctiphanes norvegica]